MTNKHFLFVVIIFSFLVSVQSGTLAQETVYRIVGYYTSWSIYSAEYFVTDIPAEQLTHINYAFMNISDAGTCVLGDSYADVEFRYPDDPDGLAYYGNIRQLHLLRTINPDIKIMMSIGGVTWSNKFSDVALTPQSRQLFVNSCIQLMNQYEFDGIDVDWEFPVLGRQAGRAEDKENFTHLLAEFHQQLQIEGATHKRQYFLSIAAPAISHFYSNIDIEHIHPYLDWINLMGYGYAGNWTDTTNHDSGLYASISDPNAALGRNTNTAVHVYLAAGVPAEKIVLGVPFYGRGWTGVSVENNGLYQIFEGLPQGSIGSGFFPYHDLVDFTSQDYTRYWDIQSQSAWLYNPSLRITISYEDPQALRAKAQYVKMMQLGGMMLWELSYDTHNHSLTTIIFEELYN